MINKKVIILIVLSICALFSIIYGLTAAPRLRSRSLPGQDELVIREEARIAKEAMKLERVTERTEFAEYKKNPFIPKVKHAEAKRDVILNGILWDKTTPAAIINNEVVGVGDVIEGNTVVGITPNKVILNNGAGDFELTLGR